jgi:polyisoprenoid-binding protein YceI
MSAASVESAVGLPTGTWTIDPVHSNVAFAVDYHVGTFRGSFSPISATLEGSEDGQYKLTGSVPVSGVQVQDANLAGHLQAPDFFDAERAPELTFLSTSIVANGADVQITGDLSIKGTTLPITIKGTAGPQKLYMERPYFGLTLAATLDRTAYGVSWQNPLPNGEPALGNEVTVTAELYFTQAA